MTAAVVFKEPTWVCPTCHGRRVWQLHDGAVEECPRCGEDGPDPNVCGHCDHQRAFHLPSQDGVCLGIDCDCVEFAAPYLIGDVA